MIASRGLLTAGIRQTLSVPSRCILADQQRYQPGACTTYATEMRVEAMKAHNPFVMTGVYNHCLKASHAFEQSRICSHCRCYECLVKVDHIDSLLEKGCGCGWAQASD